MNRKEANNQIGKQIRVVDPLLGCYIGELVDIIAEPRKPWRGKVKINSVEQYPVQNLSDIQEQVITRPPFASGKIYEIPGSKIEPVDISLEDLDFDQSLIKALVYEINYFQDEKDKISSVLSELQNELKKIDPSYEGIDDEAEYQYYTIFKNENYVYLIDDKQHQIPLDECPFDFQMKLQNKWTNVNYVENLTFVDDNKKLHKINEGGQLRLNKEQFDPYHLFINELEKPALDSLTNGLKKFNMSHEHCVNCHNTLLNQYLSSEEGNSFKGVNFSSYQNDRETLLVQHHYEREISDDGDDITYDRFEFTSDKGKRLLVTYTTEKSK